MSQRAILSLALVGVIAAQLLEWSGVRIKSGNFWNADQNRFELRILETTVIQSAAPGLAAIIVTLDMTNLGDARTVDDFKLLIRQRGREIPTELVPFAAGTNFEFRSKRGASSRLLRASNWLPAKTTKSPLQRGESRSGFLLFWSEYASGAQIIHGDDTQFAISFSDSNSLVHEAVYNFSELDFHLQ